MINSEEKIEINISKQATQQLFESVANGNLEGVKAAIENGADVNAYNSSDSTALYTAISNRNRDIVEILLALPAIDVNKCLIVYNRDSSAIPLHYAVQTGQLEIVKLLLKHPTINAAVIDDNDFNALDTAIHSGHYNLVMYLDALRKDGERVYPELTAEDEFIYCASCGRPGWEVSEKLNDLVNNSNENIEDALGMGVILSAQNGHTNNFKFLVNKLIDTIGEQRARLMCVGALFGSAENGHKEVIECGLNALKISVNDCTTDGGTLLHTACFAGHKDIVQLLLNCPDIDVKKRDKDHANALFNALQGESIAIYKLLLKDPRIDVNAIITRDREDTVLIWASRSGCQDYIEPLLSHASILVNEQDKYGETALHFAARYGYSGIVGLLLGHPEIDTKIEDGHGCTPAQVAEDYGHTNIVSLIKEHQEHLQRHVQNPVLHSPRAPINLSSSRRESNAGQEQSVDAIEMSGLKPSLS